jgi:hypothetical protein
LNSPGATTKKVALALALTAILTPNAFAATDDQNSEECQKLLNQGQSVVSSEAKSNGHRWVKAKILINASGPVVWETVHEERKRDPDLEYSKILKSENNQLTLEQKFALLPVIGTATCVMINREVLNERIDYEMVSSDHFKAMEGSWVLTPGKTPDTTYLELSSYVDMGLPVPRMMIDGITGKKLQRRLANVKIMAEATTSRLALHNEK